MVCNGPAPSRQAMLELNGHLPGRHMGKEKCRQNMNHAVGVEAEQIVQSLGTRGRETGETNKWAESLTQRFCAWAQGLHCFPIGSWGMVGIIHIERCLHVHGDVAGGLLAVCACAGGLGEGRSGREMISLVLPQIQSRRHTPQLTTHSL